MFYPKFAKTLLGVLLLPALGWAQATAAETAESFLTLTDLDAVSYPYALNADCEASVFAKQSLTIALDVTMGGDLSSDGAFICASDVTVTSDDTNYNNTSTFVAYGAQGGKVRMYATAKSKGWYTASATQLTASTNHKVVIVIDASTQTRKVYVDGTAASITNVFQDFNHFSGNDNANIYIGGGVTSAGDKYVFNGKVHSAQFFDAALSAEQVADLDYPVILSEIEQFANGDVYTFVTQRGWMGATSSANVISTARTTVTPAPTADNENFQWTIYKSRAGNYYLYNIGKQMFMGVQSANNTSVPFVATPAGRDLTFKKSSSTEYPFMFSTNNSGVVNHSDSHGEGLITWTAGWNNLTDEGSNHKITKVGTLDEASLAAIAAKVEAYDLVLPVKAEVQGDALADNTHFGNVTVTSSSATITCKLKTFENLYYFGYDPNNENTISFTRGYRGFEFSGFYLGEESLGESFVLTDDMKSSITDENPLIAKFAPTADVTLFYDDDDYSYRIPAITKTASGRLVAVSDYRHSLDDLGRDVHGTGTHRIDLVVRTSDDNGATWSAKRTIAQGSGTSGANDCGYGDAAIAASGQKVLVMAAAGDVCYSYASATSHNRTVRIYSEDNGETWTKTDISDQLFIGSSALIANGHAAFFGSGKLAVDENFNGTGTVRIYGAMLVKNDSATTNIYVIYTDDFGATWKILGGSQTPVANADEPKVEILPNGQILLSARRVGGRKFNVFTYGEDKANGAGTWSTAVDGCSNGGGNGTNGEIYCIKVQNIQGEQVDLLMQSQPKGGASHYDRRDVTIWYKEVSADATYTPTDIANGWTQGLQVSTQLSSYSAMIQQADEKIAFFFEEAPCYGDDYTKGYCMVYVPLDIHAITNSKYFNLSADISSQISTINVTLTDAQGNVYTDVLNCSISQISDLLTSAYPFITLGDNASLTEEGGVYSYTNSVILPFKVSNADATYWHNIYFPSNGNPSAYPIYLYANTAQDAYVPKVTQAIAYGDSQYNTYAHADKMSWAVYSVDNGFTFKFKNKLTDKYIKVTGVEPSSNAQNTAYAAENEASVFEILPDSSSARFGDYSLKSEVNGTVGYLCSTSAGYGYVTHFARNDHEGGWVKFVDAPDFEALIAEANAALAMLGDGLGQYSGASEETVAAAIAAMEDSENVKLNTLKSYATIAEGASLTLNMPVEGQYFRVAYDYGGSAGKLYMQSEASSVKGLQFAADTDNSSVWLYYDGALYSYTAAQCVREVGDDRGLQTNGGKTNVTFSASSRAAGKYNIACTSFIHANSNSDNYFTDHCSGDGGHAAHDLILEEVDMRPSVITVDIDETGVSTFFADHAVAIPSGVKAYVATQLPTTTANAGEEITLIEITDGVIPAETGVVVKAETNTYEFAPADASGTSVSGNMLAGYAGVFESETVALPTDDSVNYVLNTENGKVVFSPVTEALKVNYSRAYLNVPSSNGEVLSIAFGRNPATGINEVTTVDGGSDEVYDLQGRKLSKIGKSGIYIVNGKKVLVK